MDFDVEVLRLKTIGASFRDARESKGLTFDEVSKATKISRATLMDIENEKFEKYRRDELYVKNYIKRLAAYYGLDEKELIDSYLDITHEISLSEIKKKNIEKEIQASQEAENNFTSNLNDTFTDLKKVSTIRKEKRSKRVYKNNNLRDNFRYIIIFIVVVIAMVAIFYGINTFTSRNSDNNFDSVATPQIQDNTDTITDGDATDVTDDQTTTQEDPTVVVPTVEYVKNGALDYTITLPEDAQTFTFKVVFVGRTWAALSVNDSNYDDFAQRIYNDSSSSDEGETVEITFNVADFDNLDLRLGYNEGHLFYVNDVELVIDASEYTGNPADFIMNLEK